MTISDSMVNEPEVTFRQRRDTTLWPLGRNCYCCLPLKFVDGTIFNEDGRIRHSKTVMEKRSVVAKSVIQIEWLTVAVICD